AVALVPAVEIPRPDVRAGAMGVHHDGLRDGHHTPPGQAQPPRRVGVFVVAEELRGDAADFAQTAGANHGSAAAETEDVGGHRAGEVPAVTERGEGYTHGLGAARAVDQAGAG